MNHDELRSILDRQDNMLLDMQARVGAITMEVAHLRAIMDADGALARGLYDSLEDAIAALRQRALDRLDRYHQTVLGHILESVEIIDAGTAARLDQRSIEDIEASLD